MTKKKQTFEELMQTCMGSYSEMAAQTDRLQEWLKKAEQERDNKAKEINRMKRLEGLLNSARQDILRWHIEREGKRDTYGNSWEWREEYRFICAMYSFRIFLTERPSSQYKRDKWEVRVYADCIRMKDFPTRIDKSNNYVLNLSGYEYASNKYAKWEPQKDGRYGYTPIKGQELLTRHASEEKARQHVALWMERLLADHKSDLDYERELATLIQAPKTVAKPRQHTASRAKKVSTKKSTGKTKKQQTRRKRSA